MTNSDSPMSPMKQHPGGWWVLDYPEWARRTRQSDPKPTEKIGSGLEDRRFNNDPVIYYGEYCFISDKMEHFRKVYGQS